MTYSKELSQLGKERLLPTFEQILRLADGASALLSFSSSQIREKDRVQIYTWLHSNQIKHLFRIKRIGSSQLLIERLSSEAPVFKALEKEHNLLPHLERILFSTLLPIEEENECINCLTNMELSAEITSDDTITLLKEWKRIMGKE